MYFQEMRDYKSTGKKPMSRMSPASVLALSDPVCTTNPPQPVMAGPSQTFPPHVAAGSMNAETEDVDDDEEDDEDDTE